MAVENKNSPTARSTLVVVAVGLTSLIAGTLGGYVGYSFVAVGNSPLIRLQGSSSDSPFDQTYRGMGRLQGLELVTRGCNDKPVSLAFIERETQVIDQIEVSSKKVNLNPPLNLARAIVSHRAATIANMHSDERASASALHQEAVFLQQSGWKDISSNHFASIIRASDGCEQDAVGGKEKK